MFKFADKPGVWFFCQIQMCMKGSHSRCNGMTPPTCASGGGGGFTEEESPDSGGRGGFGNGNGNGDRGSGGSGGSNGGNTNEIQETIDGDYETSLNSQSTGGPVQVKTTTKAAEYGDYSVRVLYISFKRSHSRKIMNSPRSCIAPIRTHITTSLRPSTMN